uniref:Uncharacterized protein n=1 Tax=Oryza brachyantha TaxID=4533 RepID=J3MEZ6_ORYBR
MLLSVQLPFAILKASLDFFNKIEYYVLSHWCQSSRAYSFLRTASNCFYALTLMSRDVFKS